MKKTLSIIGAVLVCIGMLMATGVDYNPWQAVYAAVLIGAASVCFNRADAIGKREKSERMRKLFDDKRSTIKTAA